MCHSSHTDKRNAPNDDGMNTEPIAKQSIEKKRRKMMNEENLTTIHTHIRKYAHCTTSTTQTKKEKKNN